MLAAALSFTVMTTLIKFLGVNYPAALQSFYRQAAGLLVMLPFILRDWRGAFRTTRPGILWFRSGVGSIALILSFYSFQALPLAEANALSFTRTLWLVPLAAFVLREKVGPARVSATLVGFVGVLLMLNPTEPAEFSWAQLAALAASLLFAFTITGMKVLTRDHSPFVLLTYATALGALFSLPPALLAWRWPSWTDLALLSAMGVIGTLTQACYIKGMQIGDAAAMAPIDYTRLVFAVVAGALLFDELPNLMTIGGALIVIASTLVISWREHLAARRTAATPSEPTTSAPL